MIEEDRIKIILNEIEKLWEKNPDLRLMQLLHNILGHHKDHFYCEDDELLKVLVDINKNIAV